MFETYVVGQWVRWRDWHCPSANLWFWRDQQGNEVDLLIEHDGLLTPIECKLKQKPSARDLRGISKLRAFYGDEVGHAFVACTTEFPFDLDATATAISGWRASEIADRIL